MNTDESQQSPFFPPSLQHTKILCTLGPATATQERIKQLILAGADAVRLNFSHSRYETHRKLLDMTRAAATELDRHIPIVQDLQGPKIRIGALPDGPVLLRPASQVALTIESTHPRRSPAFRSPTRSSLMMSVRAT